MFSPLALAGEGFHLVGVKLPLAISLALLLGTPALAQVESIEELLEQQLPQPVQPDDDGPLDLPPPEGLTDLLERLEETPPGSNTPQLPDPDALPDVPPVPPEPDAGDEGEDAPDYSRLSSNEERAARLDDMFARLAEAETEKQAELIAEEIWSVWTRSGSPSVDFVLRRAASAQGRGKTEQARALFDTVIRLQPDFAEAYARSARLALDERDFSRAVGDSIRALQHEPRHYYALWTLGSVLERLGQKENALEAYREAHALYPELALVKARVEALEAEVDGGVL